MHHHLACLICANKQLLPMNNYTERHGLVKCAKCDFVFIRDIPSNEVLEAHYSQYAYTSAGYLSELTIKSYAALLDEFEPYRKHNKILDIGCGRGWFLIEAKKRGWEVYGSEFSAKAIEICKANGIHMWEGALTMSSFPSNGFDVVTSFEVLEHINNPIEELQIIQHVMRPKGLFYCTTPNFNSAMRYYLKENYNVIEYPEHLSYYTKGTLNKVVRAAGLVPIKFLTTGISITRFNSSRKATKEQFVAVDSADEVLRKKLDSRWYLRWAKSGINRVLTWTNLGMTLKGYYIKP